MKTITAGVHQISLPPFGFINTYLLETSEGLVLVDTGLPGSEAAILGAMHELGYAPHQLAHIVLTHAHADHIGSVAALVSITGAKTWMHQADIPIAEGAPFRPLRPLPTLMGRLFWMARHKSPEKVAPARIDNPVQGGMILPFGPQVIHIPGHCAGQIALLWPEKRLLIAADACMNAPLCLGLRQSPLNEDPQLGRQSLTKLTTLGFDIACFGHGRAILKNASAAFETAF